MARQILWTPKAEADLKRAFDWYEKQLPGLGDEFVDCIELALAVAASHPQRFPLRFDEIRRVLIRRFPYAVYFEADEGSITVHYVFHCAQDPARLGRRMKKR